MYEDTTTPTEEVVENPSEDDLKDGDVGSDLEEGAGKEDEEGDSCLNN